MLEKAKTLKESRWKSIQSFVQWNADISEDEEYNWLVAARYR